jgi:hypothetical protein
MFCREQAVQLHRAKDAVHQRGAELVIVGNGDRHFARAFVDELGITTPVYVDTTRESYRALGMKRGVARTIGSLGSWLNAARALRSGSRQQRIQGDPWQLGGVLVVLPGGEVTFRQLSESAGDHPQVAEVVAALPQPDGTRGRRRR